MFSQRLGGRSGTSGKIDGDRRAQPHQIPVVTDVSKGDQADAGNETIGLMAELERLVIVHATGDFRAILAEGPGCTIHLCCTGE